MSLPPLPHEPYGFPPAERLAERLANTPRPGHRPDDIVPRTPVPLLVPIRSATGHIPLAPSYPTEATAVPGAGASVRPIAFAMARSSPISNANCSG